MVCELCLNKDFSKRKYVFIIENETITKLKGKGVTYIAPDTI